MGTTHKRINSIEKLEVNGRELTDTDEIKTEITNFYQNTEKLRIGGLVLTYKALKDSVWRRRTGYKDSSRKKKW